MRTTVLCAGQVINDAIKDGRFRVEGSQDRLLQYFVTGASGKSGFIVEGDIDRFAEYVLLSAAGVSGVLSDAAARGASGFVIKGDYELAWSRLFLENAANGASGFTIQKV